MQSAALFSAGRSRVATTRPAIGCCSASGARLEMSKQAGGMAELAIYMMPEEIDLLREASRKRHHVVEFGCGGSTILFLENEVEALDSVESDKAWAAKVCGIPSAATALRSGRFRIHKVNIGQTK